MANDRTTTNACAYAHARDALALAIALAMAATNGAAMTITVNDPGDSGSPSGCTLRHAVASINASSFGADPCGSTGVGTFGTNDTIVFDPALANATVFVSNGGPLTLTAPMQITGSGQTISAGTQSAVLDSRSNSTISGVTLTDGRVMGPSGGAIVVNGGTLNLVDSAVTHSYDKATYAGAIEVTTGKTLNMTNTTVTNNTIVGYNGSGAIHAFHGTVTLTSSTISGNTTNVNSDGKAAGAVYIRGGTLRLLGSTISGNYAAKFHFKFPGDATGGIYSYNSVISVINSTIAGNHGNCGGHGVATGALIESHDSIGYSSAGVTLTNTTISGNLASTTSSGAPYGYTANYVIGGVLFGRLKTTTATAANTIISGNTATGLGSTAVGTDFGTLTGGTLSIVHSLLGTQGNVSPYNDAANSNLFSDTPGLGLLRNNGGSTKTMALLPGSPALDHGSNALAVDASSNPLTTDQAGNPRILNGTVDIGAYEGDDRIFEDGFDG